MMRKNNKKILFFVMYLCFLATKAQELPKIKIQANKILALVEYVKNISSSRQIILKQHFEKSSFFTDENQKLLNDFNALDIQYSFKFQGFPNSRRNRKNVLDTFTIMASNVSSLQELKQNSIGLFQLSEHQKLFTILERFKPIYDELFQKDNKEIIRKKIVELNRYKNKLRAVIEIMSKKRDVDIRTEKIVLI